METKDLPNGTNEPEKGAEGAVNQEQAAAEQVNTDRNELVIEDEASQAKDVETESEVKITEEQVVEAVVQKEEGTKNTIELPDEDFSLMSKKEMLTRLNEYLRHFEIEQVKDRIEDIKVNFYKKHKVEVDAEKLKFIEEGGVEEEFIPANDSEEETFKELYNQFRVKRSQLNRKQEDDKQENLKKKFKIIDEISELINNEESINKTFQEFRDLQNRWREIGLVPQSALKNLWESYNHTVESFYDYIKINKELRDLDLKKNLEDKIELCEKTESLILEESITKAFKILQEHHSKWREIGPVPREQKDDIWERFKAATTQINRKHQEYFENMKDAQVKNLEQKEALCEKVESILDFSFDKPKDWEDKANELIEIQKLWRTIGFAPKKDNNKIYQRFKTACDKFFMLKREFYKGTKDIQKNNLQLKLDLCVQAEALKDNTEWKKTTEDFIKLQKRWKEIGPVPKKHSDALWKRFRTACDSFFNTKSLFFSTIDSRQEENLELKLALIEKVKSFEKTADEKESLRLLMDYQKEWSDIGHVPLNKKDEITKEFRESINNQFNKLKIDASEVNNMNFKNKVENWASSNSKGKIYSERNKLITKIRELENEIALYENNIGFFSKSSNSSSMINDITRKIDSAKERMDSLKTKLKLLDSVDEE